MNQGEEEQRGGSWVEEEQRASLLVALRQLR